MAHIWMDAENAGANVLPRSSRKASNLSLMGDNAQLQSSKKNVLTSLDNVMYNKANVTPFKGNANINNKWPMSCAPKPSLCKETLQKQHRKQYAKEAPPLSDVPWKPAARLEIVAENDLYAKSADPNDEFDLFDFMDFPTSKCLSNCHKAASHSWQEPLLSEDLMDKLLNYSSAFEEEMHHGEYDDILLYPDNDDDELKLQSFEDDTLPDSLDDTEPPLPDLMVDAAPPLPALFEIF